MAKKKEKTIMDESVDKFLNQRRKLKGLQDEVIKSIFIHFPNLQSMEIDCSEEYDDNNYYTQVNLTKINGIDLPESLSDTCDMEYLVENDDFKGALVEMNLKQSELESIAEAFFTLETSYLQGLDDELEREKILA